MQSRKLRNTLLYLCMLLIPPAVCVTGMFKSVSYPRNFKPTTGWITFLLRTKRFRFNRKEYLRISRQYLYEYKGEINKNQEFARLFIFYS